MVARKRARDEMESEAPQEEQTPLQRLRNMWQFANLAQYIFLFKGALKIDEDFDIEVRDCALAYTAEWQPHLAHWVLTTVQELETECMMPQPSVQLAAIGLALLKHVSSHKGLTYAACPRIAYATADRDIDLKFLMSMHDASSSQKLRHETLSASMRRPTNSTTSMSSPR